MRGKMYDDDSDHMLKSPDAVIAIKYALAASRNDMGAVRVIVSIILQNIRSNVKVGQKHHSSTDFRPV